MRSEPLHQDVEVLARADQNAICTRHEQQRLPISPTSPFNGRPQGGEQGTPTATYPPDAVFVESDDQRDPSRQQQRQQADRTREAEYRGGELHVNHVKVEAAKTGGRGEHSENAPVPGHAHGPTAASIGPLSGSQQDGLQAALRQLPGEPARVVRYAVAGGIEVSADKPDPKRPSL